MFLSRLLLNASRTSLLLSVFIILNYSSAQAAPLCNSSTSDPDGDGWGWENNQSCIVDSSSNSGSTGSSGHPDCQSASSDPDGDGWGWENNRSCKVVQFEVESRAGSSQSTNNQNQNQNQNQNINISQVRTTAALSTEQVSVQSSSTTQDDSSSSNEVPICSNANSDPDEDLWGWENGQSCRVTSNSSGGAEVLHTSFNNSYSSDGPASGYPPCPEVYHAYTGEHHGWGWDWTTESYCDPFARGNQTSQVPTMVAAQRSGTNSRFIDSSQSTSNSNGLHVCGNTLCNGQNNPIQLTGMSSHGIHWYGWNECLNDQAMDTMAYDWGANLFRIAMYVNESKVGQGQYAFDTDESGNIQHVNRLINEANERGMYALVDYHKLNPGGDPRNEISLRNLQRTTWQWGNMGEY